MASGNTLASFTPHHNQPAASAFATLDVRNQHLVLDFDAAADETAIFPGVLSRAYAGGGITAKITWCPDTATSGTCRWFGQFERMNSTFDIDANSFDATGASAGGTAVGAGQIVETELTFTDGARLDSLAVGEAFRFMLTRDADGTTGTDDMAGDASLLRVELRET